MKKVILLLTLCCAMPIISIAQINSSTFQASVQFPTNTKPMDLAVADFDMDGKPDMVSSNITGDDISVLKNQITGGVVNPASFASAVHYPVGANTDPFGVDAGDIDGDGKPEIVTANRATGTISVFLNATTPGVINASSFATRLDFTAITLCRDVVIADFDGDGMNDVAAVSQGLFSVWRNTSTIGNISFASRYDKTHSSNTGHGIAAGDIDGDGKLDIAVASESTSGSGALRTSLNQSVPGGIAFQNINTFNMSNYQAHDVTLADLNGDNKLDAIASGEDSGNSVCSLYVWSNTSTLGAINFFGGCVMNGGSQYGGQGVGAGDIDGDGKREVMIVYQGNALRVQRNIYTTMGANLVPANFENYVSFPGGTGGGFLNYSRMRVFDLTGDGKLEAMITDDISNDISVYKNASTGVNTITTGTVVTTTCPGANVSVPYISNIAAIPGNIFTAELSDASGSFASPVAIGTLASTISGTISASIPGGTPAGSNYRIRVVSSSPVVTGSDNGTDITIGGPYPVSVSIVISPSNNVCSGTSVTFTATPTNGGVTPSYQWKRNTTNVGTNNPVFTTATYANGDVFTVVLTSSLGSCGAGNPATSNGITMNVTSIPGQPSAITGPTAVCQGATNTYSVTNVAGVTYNWNLPAGFTGSSTTNSISVTAGAASGTISVTATNSCGTSPVRNLNVIVSVPPATAAAGPDQDVCTTTATMAGNAATPGTGMWTVISGAATFTTPTSPTSGVTALGLGANTLRWTTSSGSCTSTFDDVIITRYAVPATPGAISGGSTICSGATQTFSITAVSGATSYTWTLPGGWSGTSTTNSISATAGATGGNITVVANNTCGSSGVQTLVMTVNTVPATPGTISGSVSVCQTSAQTYSITAVPTATSYTWTLPAGWGGSSTTTSINSTVGASSGNVTVTANNTCGSSTAQTLAVTISPVPSVPGSISGNATVCATTAQTYSVTAVGGATSYTWTMPGGWTGTSTTNSINATSSSTSGNISVTANNACGSSAAQTLAVSVTPIPGTPGSISGSTTVCQSSSNTYSITAVAGATSYNWTLPGGWSGTSTTNSISATAGASGGNISVSAGNVCGNSSNQTLAIAVNNPPATPGTISGNATVCATSAQTYAIGAVAGATSYTWTLPAGWSGTSTTNLINSTVGASGGVVAVTANNSCGSSTAQILFITVNPVPAVPGSISGSTTVCSSTSQTYSVTAVGGATSYTWTMPGGWTGTSTTNSINATSSSTSGNITVTANNACGSSAAQTVAVTVNTVPATPGSISGSTTVCATSSQPYSVTAVGGATSYTWTLPGSWTGTSTTNSINTTVGSGSGNITVTANNACGTSTAQLLAVTVSPVPATPGSISGNASVCSSSSQTYSVAAVGGATSYTWTFPGGWSGASTTNSINATTGSTSGNISVTANNACGSSAAQTLSVTINTAPAQPASISGSTNACASSVQTYSVTNDPLATGYTWTLPGGWSGSSTTNAINATINASGGNITVTANNACGSSTVQTLNVSVNPTPAVPTPINGGATVCSGSSQTYSVTNDPTATGYTWTLPGGWIGSSVTNSITVTAGAAGGNISVTANNACGSSSAQTLSITVTSTPSTPGSVSGSSTVCNGTPQTYSVTNDPTATSYTWTLPGSWTGTSATNAINTTAGNSGTIQVTANNACGNSGVQTLTVTVNNIPAQPSSVIGSNTVCEGTSQSYSVTNDVNATSYSWTLPATWSGTSTTNAVNSTAGTSGGTISVIANNSCGSSPAQNMSVTVNTLPTVTLSLNANAICVDNALFVFAGGSPTGGTYAGPGVSSGSFNATTAGIGIHNITYTFTDGNGCSNSNTDQITVNNCTGISDIGNGISDMVVYPNPTNGMVTLSGMETCGECSLVMYSLLGEIVYQSSVTSSVMTVDLSDANPGVYFIQIRNENTSVIKKIVKE